MRVVGWGDIKAAVVSFQFVIKEHSRFTNSKVPQRACLTAFYNMTRRRPGKLLTSIPLRLTEELPANVCKVGRSTT